MRATCRPEEHGSGSNFPLIRGRVSSLVTTRLYYRGDLRQIHARPTADADDGLHRGGTEPLDEVDDIPAWQVGLGAVIDGHGDTLLHKRFDDLPELRTGGHTGVGHHQDSLSDGGDDPRDLSALAWPEQHHRRLAQQSDPEIVGGAKR